MIRMPLSVRNENVKVSFHGTDDFQNLRYEALLIADYVYVKIIRLAVLDIKYGAQKTIVAHRSHLIFIQIRSLEGAKFMQNVALVNNK